MEQLLSLCGQISNSKDSDVAAELQINYIILLKTSLEVLPALKEILASANSNFFINLKEVSRSNELLRYFMFVMEINFEWINSKLPRRFIFVNY